ANRNRHGDHHAQHHQHAHDHPHPHHHAHAGRRAELVSERRDQLRADRVVVRWQSAPARHHHLDAHAPLALPRRESEEAMKFNKYDWLFNAAFLLRFAGIWIPQLWYDENFTLILARLPFDRMIAATAGDVHPPLWYLIEWMFIRLFPDPVLLPAWTLRIPAFACSIFAFVFFARVLNELRIPKRVK